LPDEMTASIAVLKYPAMPQVPEPMRGKVEVIVRAAFAGHGDQGAALIQPWLDWHAPASNTFHEMPFSEIGSIQNDPVNPASSTGPEARITIKKTIETYKTALQPYTRGGVYLNFISGFLADSELGERTKDAYHQKAFERLVALKTQYDPDNTFRFSYQIAPR